MTVTMTLSINFKHSDLIPNQHYLSLKMWLSYILSLPVSRHIGLHHVNNRLSWVELAHMVTKALPKPTYTQRANLLHVAASRIPSNYCWYITSTYCKISSLFLSLAGVTGVFFTK